MQHLLNQLLHQLTYSDNMTDICTIFETQEKWEHVHRLKELGEDIVSHEWIGCLNPICGAILPSHLFLIALKIRLGVPFLVACVDCPKGVVKVQDVCGLHRLCCARGESTKGHYCVRDRALELVHLADSSAVTEIRNLFPDAPNLRPADIFTVAALPGRMTALDIGICSPDACNAGLDCCDSMYSAKIDKYSQHLRLQNEFEYRPLVFSCYGRVRPEAVAIFRTLAQVAARKHGVIDSQGLLARLYRNVGVEIWRRAACMVYDCMPKTHDSEREFLHGRDPTVQLASEVDIAGVVCTNTSMYG